MQSRGERGGNWSLKLTLATIPYGNGNPTPFPLSNALSNMKNGIGPTQFYFLAKFHSHFLKPNRALEKFHSPLNYLLDLPAKSLYKKPLLNIKSGGSNRRGRGEYPKQNKKILPTFCNTSIGKKAIERKRIKKSLWSSYRLAPGREVTGNSREPHLSTNSQPCLHQPGDNWSSLLMEKKPTQSLTAQLKHSSDRPLSIAIPPTPHTDLAISNLVKLPMSEASSDDHHATSHNWRRNPRNGSEPNHLQATDNNKNPPFVAPSPHCEPIGPPSLPLARTNLLLHWWPPLRRFFSRSKAYPCQELFHALIPD